jgi:hypothetical protein
LFDPLSARGHEIPPDVPRALERSAAEEHETRAPRCSDGDPVARTKDEKPRAFECLARDVDLAVGDVDRPLLLVGIERCTRARGKHDFCIKPFRQHPTGDFRPKAEPAITRARTPPSSIMGRLAASKC